MVGLFQEYNPVTRIPSNQYDISPQSITSGSLISFVYPHSYAIVPNIIHDPYPMVLVTDIWPRYVRGVNLHYLTFPYIKKLLTNFGAGSFNYQMHIKPDKYLANSFRMYVRQGIRQPRKLDTEFLVNVLASVRSFSPGEIEKIRMNIQKQIQARLQAKAEELTSYEQWRKGLSQSQGRQLQSKGLDIQKALTGGVERNLIYPNEGSVGFHPSNQPPQPGEGGPTSTQG